METSQCAKMANVDRLSPLPDDLLMRILCLAKSYKAAVVCSSVSPRFRHLYRNLPCIYLRKNDFYKPPMTPSSLFQDDDEDEDEDEDIEDEFDTDAINRISASVIHGHQGSLHTFSLDAWFCHFDIWESPLDYLLRHHHIEHLSVILWHCHTSPHIPLCVFDCHSLLTLTMEFFNIHQIPDTFQGFPNLRDCNLCLEFFCDDDIEIFTSLLPTCPALQNLKLELNLNYSGCAVPLIFSSPSLLTLDVYFTYLMLEATGPQSRRSLEIEVQTPELLMLNLESFNCPDVDVEAYFEAPKLLELSVPSEHIAMDINGFPKVFRGILNAKWTSDHHHHLTSLQFTNVHLEDVDDTPILRMISMFNSLGFLELSMIHAHPMEFQRMLACLPLLEKLMLSDCYFLQEKEDQESLDVANYNFARLTEVCFTNGKLSCLDGERKMLCILMQMAPNLKTLRVVLEREKIQCKDKYAAVLKQLMSDGDDLNIKESSEQVQFTILGN